MEEQIFNTILANTFTARKLQKRLRVLKLSLLAKIFGASSNISDQSEIEEEKEWLSTLNTDLLNQITKDTIYPLFSNLDAKIKNCQVLTIYTAVDLPAEEVARLSGILRQQYGSLFLFDVKFDPNIIAGAALVWKGIYRDYSVRSMIGEKKTDILNEFRKFIGRNG